MNKIDIAKLKEIKENLILLLENDIDIFVNDDSLLYIIQQIDDIIEYDDLMNIIKD
jgi:hypothetical protein